METSHLDLLCCVLDLIIVGSNLVSIVKLFMKGILKAISTSIELFADFVLDHLLFDLSLWRSGSFESLGHSWGPGLFLDLDRADICATANVILLLGGSAAFDWGWVGQRAIWVVTDCFLDLTKSCLGTGGIGVAGNLSNLAPVNLIDESAAKRYGPIGSLNEGEVQQNLIKCGEG